MADELTPKQLMEHIDTYLKGREGMYTAGDRELANLGKQMKMHLSRLAGLDSGDTSPGSRAAIKSAQEQTRTGPGGVPYDMKTPEPRGVENQPKTFEDARSAFDEAHKKFMEQVGAGNE